MIRSASTAVLRRSVRVATLISFIGLQVAGPAPALAAPFAATASMAPLTTFLNDAAGTVFTYTVNNTGTSTSIGAVEISRPSNQWTVLGCPSAPSGWTAQVSGTKCRFKSGTGTADDIAPGGTATFDVRAGTLSGNADRSGTWKVSVSSSDNFAKKSLLSAAAVAPGLTATVHSWEILDAIVDGTPSTPGAPCPSPATHSAVTGSTGHTLVICGRNRMTVAATPTQAQSSIAGTFVASAGSFSSGSIAANSASSVVLGTWSNVTITSTAGTGKTVIARIGSAANRTSPLTTLGGYEALNQPPVANDDTYSIAENTTLTVPAPGVLTNDTDPDGDPIDAVLGTGPAHATSFALNPDGSFTYTPVADFIGADGFTYRARDPFGALSGTATVTLNVTEVNEAPAVNDATFSIAESSAAGTAVGTVTFTDPNAGQSHTFAITAGNTGDAFTIDPSTGQITVATPSALNFETTPSFSLTVRVTDNGSPALFGEATITVNLTDVNDAPAVDDATFSVAENSSAGTAVGTVTFSDDDAGQQHLFAITAGNTGDAFAIDPATGAITVNDAAALDFETTPTFSLTVTVTDNGTPPLSGSATITINLTDVNEAPEVDDATFSVAEGAAAGTAVGTVTFTDPDAGQSHTFAITAGNTGDAFAIDPLTGEITVAGVLDVETTPTYTLTVQVTDDGTPPLSGTGTITINVTDVNEAPDVDDATFSTAEGSAAGTAVGTVTFSDADAGQDHTFAITAGNTGDAFAIDPATGEITILTPSAIDFETTPTFSLTVQVTDDGTPPLSGTATITINVTNVNEPPEVDPATFTVDENSANGTAVGTVTFTDPDAGQSHTFSIFDGNTGGAFAIDPATGAITVANSAALDFETTPTFSLTVEVIDNGTPAMSGLETITINLTDVNEAPSITAPAALSVERDLSTLLTGISVADPDAGDELTLTLTAGNGTLTVGVVTGGADVSGSGTDTVTLTGSVGEINTTLGDADGVSYLNDAGFAGASDTLDLHVADADGLFDDATVSLLFNQPPVAADVVETTAEDTPVVITLSATDPDDDDLSFSIVTGPDHGTLGAISTPDCTTEVNTCTATVTYDPDDDFNGTDSFTYEVDDGTTTDTGTVDIAVDSVNDAPIASADSFSTNEDTPLSVAAPGVLANDVDVDSPTLTAIVVTGPAHDESFALNADGSFSYAPADDFNGPDSFTYKANDGTADSNTVTVSLTVNAVNDAPVVDTSAGSASFTEGGSAVAIDPAVSVTDVDGGNLASARVQLTSGCQPGEDVLALASPLAGITVGTYVPATCTLDLTGPASIAAFQSALRAVTYANTSDNPSTADRTATFTVDDGLLTGSDTRTITVAAANDGPVISLSGSTPTFTEDGAAVTVDGGLTVTDPDDVNLEFGNVTIITGGQSGDALTFTPAGGITDTNAAADILTLMGPATVADWQTVLRSVQFSTTNQNPGTSRLIRFLVNDGNASGFADKSLTVVPVNDPPVLAGADGPTLDYTENAAPIVLTPNITVTDVDSANLVSAIVDMGSGFVSGQDVLSLGTNPQNGITAAPFDPVTGTLSLSGTASLANYQAALRDVRFANTSDNPTGGFRFVVIFVRDGPAPANNSNVVGQGVNVVPVNDAPVGNDDAFIDANGALANTRLAVGTPTTGPHLAVAGTVLANDADVDTPTGLTAGPTLISSANCAGCNNVALNSNGSFTYDPPADFVGTDTFTYTVTDNDAEAPANQTDTATVSIEVFGPVVWYVDVDAAAPPAGQGGRSHSPFQSLAPLTTGGTADTLDGAGDIIFLGADSAAPITAYDGGIVLEASQRLLGEPFGLTIDPGGAGADTPPSTVLVAAGTADPTTNPTVRNSAAGAAGIVLANGVEVQRVNAGITGSGSATGISGTGVTTATIGTNMLIQGNTTGFALSGAAGGNITVDAAINGNSGNAVSIAGRSSGTVTFNANVAGSATNVGANFAGNTGATITFTGALNLAGSGTAGTTLSASGGGTLNAANAANQVTSFNGTGIDLNGVSIGASGLQFNVVNSVIGGAVNGILLTNVGGTGAFTVNGGAITASTRGLDISGGSNNVTIATTLTTSGAASKSVEVTNRAGGTVDLNGLVTDTSQGINLSTNGTGLVRFDGGVAVSTTGNNVGFNASVSGNVAVTDTNGAAAPNNILTTVSATALSVANTTIHPNGLTFQSISAGNNTVATDPANGIVLDTTGSSGGLTVTGNGTTSQGGDNSGGTIQNTTSHAVSLSNTRDVSFTNVRIDNTGDMGINGAQVTNFSFTYGTINNAGNGSDEGAIYFEDKALNNAVYIAGTVTVTNSNLTLIDATGINVQQWAGALTNVTISNNTFTSEQGVTDPTPGSAVKLICNTTATTACSLPKATLSGNTIGSATNAFNEAGFVVQANSPTGGLSATLGIAGDATNVISVTGNLMNGGGNGTPADKGFQSDRFITSDISGNGTGNLNVSSNGTLANPIKNIDCIAIELGKDGPGTLTTTVQNNFIAINSAVGCAGIAIGTDDPNSQGAGSHSTTISGNTVSGTDGPGIFAIVRGSNSTMTARILNNNVAAPTATNAARAGIRVDSGSAVGDTTMCLEMTGNTTAGSTNTATSTTSPGINLRKQGTDPAINTFGIEGMAATSSPGVENYVNALNTSTSGTFGVGGTALLSAQSGFTTCSAP